MSPTRALLATAAGLVLFAIPFVRYLHLGDPAAPHTDHRPRNGGVLRMVGDHHVELRRWRGRVEVFVSDAVRAPVRGTGGWLVLGGADRTRLVDEGDRLVAAGVPPDAALAVELVLTDGDTLSWDFGRSVPTAGSRIPAAPPDLESSP